MTFALWSYIVGRRIGLPAVSVEMTFHAPLHYGDALRIETSCAKLGTKSAVLLFYRFDFTGG